MSNTFQDNALTTFGTHRQTDRLQTHKQPKNIIPPATLCWRRHKKERYYRYYFQVLFNQPTFTELLQSPKVNF